MKLPDYLQKIIHRQTGQRGRRHLHEDNIKCLLFGELLIEGFEVIAEVKIENSRCDLVVFDGEVPICAVEVKSDKRSHINPESRQHRKYENLGIPVFYCMGFYDIDRVLRLIKRSVEEYKLNPTIYKTTDV